MRNDDVVEGLQTLPQNAEVDLMVTDRNGFEYGYEITSISYNAHTNTIHIGGIR